MHKNITWFSAAALGVVGLFTACYPNTNVSAAPNASPLTAKQAIGGPALIHLIATHQLTFTGAPSPRPTGFTDTNPQFLNGQQGFSVEPNGISYTSDGGSTWSSVPTPAGTVLGIHFVSPTTGWVVVGQTQRNDGSYQSVRILYTGDTGVHWVSQWVSSRTVAVPWPSSPRVLSFANGVLYACINGQLLQTTGPAQHWKSLSLPVNGPVMEADFSTANVGWAVVQEASASKTGSTKDSAAVDSQHRLALLKTTDGGAHWQVQMRTNPVFGGSPMLQFENLTNGLFLYKDIDTMQTVLYRTTDGGRTWHKSIPSVMEGRIFPGRPVFGSNHSVWIPLSAGAAPFPSEILASGDEGKTWTPVVNRGEWRSVYLSSRFDRTAYLDAELTSGGNALLKTTDDGRTWTQILPAYKPTQAVDFVSPTLGYGLGTVTDSNSILKTTDGGQTWNVVGTLPNGTQAYGLYFMSSNAGYVTVNPMQRQGSKGNSVVMQTNDGGQTWTLAGFGDLPPTLMQAIQNGSIVQPAALKEGSQGKWWIQFSGFPNLYTMTSTRSGSQVIATSPSPSGGIESFAFAGSNTTDGWMSVYGTAKSTKTGKNSTDAAFVGQSVIEQLDDTSKSWKPMWKLPQGWAVEGMYRVSAGESFVVAQKPFASIHSSFAIFHTTDGGSSWTEWENNNPPELSPPTGAGQSTFDINFVNSKVGWLLSNEGLLQTVDGGQTWRWLW